MGGRRRGRALIRRLSADEVLSLRMRSQRLAGRRPADVAAVVRGVGAVQAQDTRAARLAIRPRGEGLDRAAVTRACNEERSVVRTWAMRGTLHMLPAADTGWVVAFLGPSCAARDRRRRLQLGIDDDTCARALPAIRRLLDGGDPLTRAELVRSLAALGVGIDPRGQAPAHLLFYAAMQGLICRGPDQPDDEPTYVLLEQWVDGAPAKEPDAALAELARRHLGAYAPAGPRDFAAWAGIALGQARRGFQLIAAELTEVDACGEPAWMLTAAPEPTAAAAAMDHPAPAVGRRAAGVGHDTPAAGGRCVRLLPAFDTYLLGYHSRELALPRRFAPRIQAGGGWIHPTVVMDGRVVASWRQLRRAERLTVSVQPFEPLDPDLLPDLEREAADVGRFLGVEVSFELSPPAS